MKKNIYFVGAPTVAKGIEDFNFLAVNIPEAAFYWFSYHISKDVPLKFHNINFIQGLTDVQMKRKIQNSMDIFVCNSHFEGFCLPIAEAVLLRKPVVSYDLEEIRATYHNVIEYIPCFDLQQFAKRLQRLIVKNDYAVEKNEAFQFVKAHYSPNMVVKKLLRVVLN